MTEKSRYDWDEGDVEFVDEKNAPPELKAPLKQPPPPEPKDE